MCDGRVGQSVIWVLRAQERPVIAPPISSFPSVAFDLSQTETAACASVAKTYHGSLIDAFSPSLGVGEAFVAVILCMWMKREVLI